MQGGAPSAFGDAAEGEEGEVGTPWPWGAPLPTNGQCLLRKAYVPKKPMLESYF